MKKQQKGVALITILMMVALATILAASIAQHQKNTSETTTYLMRQNQTLLYAKSAEAFLSELLVEDARSNNKVDHLKETWAQPIPGFPIEGGGVVRGQIYDETSKFNLNNLVQEDGQPNPQARAFFEALLKKLELNPQLVEAVIDWQDADDLTIGPMGAESNFYSGLSKPYLASNSIFSSVDELKMVRGFDAQTFAKIKPYVTAMPVHNAKINVNTASALILASLDEKLNQQAIESEIKNKQANLQFFKSVSEVFDLTSMSQMNKDKRTIFDANFGVQSSFYRAVIEVKYPDHKRQFTSFLNRNGENVSVYMRSLAPF